MKWAELEYSDNIFSTLAGLAQNFPTRVELKLDYNLNEPIPDRQYPLKIGSFTPLFTVDQLTHLQQLES
jgi:hypothetical protein